MVEDKWIACHFQAKNQSNIILYSRIEYKTTMRIRIQLILSKESNQHEEDISQISWQKYL
jgi:hypothetical protein